MTREREMLHTISPNKSGNWKFRGEELEIERKSRLLSG